MFACVYVLDCCRVERQIRPRFAADCLSFSSTITDSFHLDEFPNSRDTEAPTQHNTPTTEFHCGLYSTSFVLQIQTVPLWPKGTLPVCILFLQVAFTSAWSCLFYVSVCLFCNLTDQSCAGFQCLSSSRLQLPAWLSHQYLDTSFFFPESLKSSYLCFEFPDDTSRSSSSYLQMLW